MPILFDAGASAGCRKFLNSPVKNLQLFLFVCFDGNPCIITEKKEKVTNILLICRGGLFFCKQNVQNAHSDFEPQTYPECLYGNIISYPLIVDVVQASSGVVVRNICGCFPEKFYSVKLPSIFSKQYCAFFCTKSS